MAKISLANLTESFSITNIDVTHSGSTDDSDSDNHSRISWLTQFGGNDVDLNGSFYRMPQDPQLMGTVTSISLDLGNDSAAKPDITVKELNLPLAAFNPVLQDSGTDIENNYFWRFALIDADTIDFGKHKADPDSAFSIRFAGDGRTVVSGENFFGNNDTMTGDIGRGFVSGDVDAVRAGGSAFCGDDKMTLGGSGVVGKASADVFGDASGVDGFLAGGDDTIIAKAGITSVCGDAGYAGRGGTVRGGNDTISATDANSIFGDAVNAFGAIFGGDDKITGGDANDQIYGDILAVEAGGYLEGGDDTIHAGAGADYVYGDAGGVNASGKAKGGRDTIYGEADIDHLSGNGGNDKIDGGSGGDWLYGGSGRDTLTGGTGTDHFVFEDLGSANADTITDFAHSEDIYLVSKAFTGLKAGGLADTAFKEIASATSTKGVDKSDRILYDLKHGDLYFDQDGSKTAHDRVLFAHVTDYTSLENTNFIIA